MMVPELSTMAASQPCWSDCRYSSSFNWVGSIPTFRL